jgi:hypothetical protein
MQYGNNNMKTTIMHKFTYLISSEYISDIHIICNTKIIKKNILVIYMYVFLFFNIFIFSNVVNMINNKMLITNHKMDIIIVLLLFILTICVYPNIVTTNNITK